MHEARNARDRGKPHCRGTTSSEELSKSKNIMFQQINFPVKPAAVPEKTSMFKRIAAVTFIFLCTTVAWAILGATIFQRTYDSGPFSDSRVESTWGAPQSQSPPQASFD